MKTQVIISAERTGYSPEQVTHTMTVGELISYLERFNEESKVYLSHDNGYTYGGIHRDSFDEREVEDYQENDDQ